MEGRKISENIALAVENVTIGVEAQGHTRATTRAKSAASTVAVEKVSEIALNGNGNENVTIAPSQRQTRATTRKNTANNGSKVSHKKGMDGGEIGNVTTKKTSVRRTRAKPLTLKEKIDNESPLNIYMINEIVLATIPGFCCWPARIVDMIGETIMVQFFGTGHINPVRSKALSRFELNKIIPLLERKGFRKAIQEIESILDIPEGLSLLKK